MLGALFSSIDILTLTHSGVKAEFYKIFIKSGIFNKSTGKLYSELFEKRQEGDYQDFYFLNKNEITPLIEKVEEFIDTIEEYIKQH